VKYVRLLTFYSSTLILNFFFFNLLKEKSPKYIGRLAQTLPPLGESFLKSSLPVTSNTSPLCFSATSLPKGEPSKDTDLEKGEVSPHLVSVFWELCGLALLIHKQMISLNMKEVSSSVLSQEGLAEHRHES